MPAISQHFTNSTLQSLFTSFTAAITKSYDLATRYQAYDTAADRVKDAYSIFRQLSASIAKNARIDFLSRPEGKNVVSDLNALYKELQRLQKGNMQISAGQMPPTPQQSGVAAMRA